jgi:glycosyltransferase involved in cell wall biosynthesis
MISVILTLYNRANLLKWCLEGIYRNTFPENKKLIEINVLDDGSDDGLDDLLQRESERFGAVNKYVWDKSKLEIPIKFNCPAQAYNLLVKLSSNEIIYKTDPEIVLLDKEFIKKSIDILKKQPNAIVMPFPYHCYGFPVKVFEDIERNYKGFVYPTHITRENAKQRMVYYQFIANKSSYIGIGGIDERFSGSIGSEDDHFLDWYKKQYGEDNFIPLLESTAIHQFHGGMASGPQGVPQQLYRWVDEGAALRKQLENIYPNQGKDWGRIPKELNLIKWSNGQRMGGKHEYSNYFN